MNAAKRYEKGDGVWGSGKNFPQKFLPLPQEPSLIEHQI